MEQWIDQREAPRDRCTGPGHRAHQCLTLLTWLATSWVTHAKETEVAKVIGVMGHGRKSWRGKQQEQILPC